MSSKSISLDRTIKWINKTEGRDKFCKAIQYACRFLKYHAEQKGDKDMALKLNGLFSGMRDARKLFRLFKSINEYQKLLEILKKGSADPLELTCNVITRLGFLLYWFFDNISILSTIKVLKRDPKQFGKYGMTFWFIALVSTLVLTLRDLYKTHAALNYFKSQSELSSEEQDSAARVRDYSKKRYELLLNLIKTLGDIIPAGQGSEILPKIGLSFTDSTVGLGGLVSAIITSYQLYD